MSGITEIFTSLIDRLVTPRLDPLALYPARVVAQGEVIGTVDVKPDDPRWGEGLAQVPILHGIPGVTVKVKRGARVLLGFAQGDVKKPFVSLWEPGSLEALTIEAETKVIVLAPSVVFGDEENAAPVATLGCVVECLMPPQVPVAGTLNGAPFAGLMTITDPILGVIDSAVSKTKAS